MTLLPATPRAAPAAGGDSVGQSAHGSPAAAPWAGRPALAVAVLMRREPLPGNCWQPWRWVLEGITRQEPGFGAKPRRLYRDARGAERWLHPGLRVELLRDDAEGYYLNATTPAPGWFVLWRMQTLPAPPGQGEPAAWMESPEEPIACPVAVSLSYHEAGRWLDAQETVEQVPAPPEVVAWMSAFAQRHYTPGVRRRQRPESFQLLRERFGGAAPLGPALHHESGPPDHG